MKIFTTVILCADGAVYDLAKLEYPPQMPAGGDRVIKNPKFIVIDAYTCTVERAAQLQSKKKKKKK